MSELVLKSMYVAEDIVVAFRPHFKLGICIQVQNEGKRAGLTISRADAHQLRDFLNKELGDQVIKPSKPQKELLILAYGADPTSAQGSRFLHVSNIAYATKLAEQLVNEKPSRPVWLGQLTKQFVQPTPAYEWKDL